MQTCPHCHNVLVSPMCCAHVDTQRVPMFSLPPGHFHAVPPATPLQHQSIHATSSNPLTNGWGESPEHPLSTLPTPHVSGLMFHFPTMNNGLERRLSACQLTCHINCITHGGTMLCPSTASSDSSSLHQHSPLRRHHSCGYPRESTPLIDLPSMRADNAARVESSRRFLELSGWYWARMSWQEAEVLLQPTEVGTFLMRDSADPHHVFSLSVQTEKGPTSVRIHCSNGKFRLKSEASVKHSLPEFSCVVRLIEFYLSSNEKYNNHVWVDAAGKVYSPIRIHRPFLKSVPSLKHLSRRAVNYSFTHHAVADRLPPSLLKYIDEYPYWC